MPYRMLMLGLLVSGLTADLHAQENGPPKTPRKLVTDHYHGTAVVDDYRWLEDWSDPEVRAWSDTQNQYAREFLSKLPHVDDIRRRVREIMSADDVSFANVRKNGPYYFAIKRQPPKQQPFLVVLDRLDQPDSARALVDPNEMDGKGSTAIDWYEPSPDGSLVAVSLSSGGSEAGDLHIFDTKTGKRVFEVIPRVNTGTAGGDMAWLPDGSGFFYTRHPREGEKPPADMNFYQQAWFHKLGTPTDKDRYELGRDFPRIAEIEFEMHVPSGQLLLTVQDGDGGQFAHYLRSPQGKWRQFSSFEDKVVQATFASADHLFAITREDAPRGRIIRIDTRSLDVASAPTIVPQGADTIVTSFYHDPPSVLATPTKLYVLYQLGGPSEIRVFDHDGHTQTAPQQASVSQVGGLSPLDGDDVLFFIESYVSPRAIMVFHAETGRTEKTPLSARSAVDMSDVEVRREFAQSKDGTRIPVNILVPKSALNSLPRPTVVYGYGGYGVNLTPRFRPTVKVLLEQGMIYAVANIRGGGEYGEEWHQQGMLTKKQNVFDDFTAAVRYMIDAGYSTPEKLAIMGGSNGGLLMGAMLTQHPELVRAVVGYVGIYDMLRVELSPNGSFNIPEFGTVRNPDHFKALLAYSPFHNVKDGTPYPAVLFLTGENDPRVDPMQSRKMTARLQAATSSGQPVLLRTTSDAGHGAGTPLGEQIEQTAVVYAFLFDRLGVKYHPPQ